LILDSERYRYQRFCSDIAGQDIQSHKASPAEAIRVVRNWLRNHIDSSSISIPGGRVILERFNFFQTELPQLCKRLKLERSELFYNDYTVFVSEWLK
jgi:hypothetical protein